MNLLHFLKKYFAMTLTFTDSFQLFKADVCRRLFLEGKNANFFGVCTIFFNRGVISVLIYRLSRYLYLKNTLVAKIFIRLLRYIEFHYCRNEIEPGAVIGGGFVLSDFGGVAISDANIIGENCTFMGKATPTLGGMEGVNILLDRIRIGDYCIFGHNVRIVNHVTIANGVQIKANSVVMHSLLTEGAVVSGFPARKIAVMPMDLIVNWSPLISKML